MAKAAKKRSPRAPSMPLDEAVERVIAVYEKEQRHPAPTDAVAQDLGYKSANNGAALSALASLKGFGLLERPEPGKLAVSADVQSFRYAPDEDLKRQLRRKWLRSPPIFAELLDKYDGGLPSDATLRFDLIEAGFNPKAAESALRAFKQSVEFAEYYDMQEIEDSAEEPEESSKEEQIEAEQVVEQPQAGSLQLRQDVDRIPVRLDHSRRAWLEIPTPFYEADKKRIKAQIDLLLTDDEIEENVDGD